ncbi:DUF3575 domain-containing protein [Aquiflexum lacus]|uniref:DUF3575 domain-containing protein n=1 Tax=Aquiflexum lacus TaxID=2483805 RepID=UPI00189429AE|nr:DUF3575 domain-containing protein [Aquiflexum lacus]
MLKKLIFLVLVMIPTFVFSQIESIEQKPLQNTIRYNLSKPTILGFGNIIFGYERIISETRSFSLDFGFNRMPAFDNEGNENDMISLLPGGKNNGIHFSADYRFYLKSENKFKAPRGVYIGPYYSFNTFNKGKNWNLTTTNFDGIVGTDLGIRYHTIGAELGYQFQLSKRLVLDFVLFGPGIGFYKLDVDFNSTLDPEDSALVLEHINELLSNKLPGFNTLIDGSGFEKTGTVKAGAFGYRLSINIGYRF